MVESQNSTTEDPRKEGERYVILSPEEYSRRIDVAKEEGSAVMTRTLAHEINNALSLPVGFIDLLMVEPVVQENPAVLKMLGAIQEGLVTTAEKLKALQNLNKPADQVTFEAPVGAVIDLQPSIAKRRERIARQRVVNND